MEKTYYSFIKCDIRFVILDGTDIGLMSHEEGSEKFNEAMSILQKLQKANQPNAETWNSAIGQVQKNWLVSELKKTKNADQRYVFSYL